MTYSFISTWPLNGLVVFSPLKIQKMNYVGLQSFYEIASPSKDLINCSIKADANVIVIKLCRPLVNVWIRFVHVSH